MSDPGKSGFRRQKSSHKDLRQEAEDVGTAEAPRGRKVTVSKAGLG